MGIFDSLNPPARSWLPRWVWQKQDARFLSALLQTKGADDDVLHPYIQRVLLIERWKRAIEPYLRIFKLAKEIIRGRYWKSAKEVDSGANQASGGNISAGAGYLSISSFSFTTTGPVNPAPPAPAFEDAGIRAGEVTAYRCWKLHEGKLYSMYQDAFCWEPGKIAEGDAAGGDGVHGFKDRLAMGAYGYDPYPNIIVVSGTVELWGEVYEHERGYRASKAAIASIDDSPFYDAKALRKTYGLTLRPRGKRKKTSRRPKK